LAIGEKTGGDRPREHCICMLSANIKFI
jgi:hypothetical protein